jgi:uncharacterized membrane protein YgcG
MPGRPVVALLAGLLLLGAALTARALDPSPGAAAAAAEPSALQAPLDAVRDADRGALEVLVAYQEPVRGAILAAAGQPQVLIAIERIQSESRAGFAALIKPLPEASRDQIWELVRYPEVIADLVESDAATREALEARAESYPEAVRTAAVEIALGHRALLGEIQQLDTDFHSQFDEIIGKLSKSDQAAFQSLLERPEVLEILTTHMHLAVLLADACARDPKGLDAALTALANDVASRTAGAQQDYVQTLQDDPEAVAELEQATQDYAEQEGIDYGSETQAPSETYVTVVVRPYPFWFGFPFAYVGFGFGFYPYGYAYYPSGWYWYPYAYPHYPCDFGFYYAPRHRIVVYGAPSHAFFGWYFGAGGHYTRYPHLTRYFTQHKRAHRYSHDRVASHVDGWERSLAGRSRKGDRLARSGAAGRVGVTHRVDRRPGRYPFLAMTRGAAGDRAARALPRDANGRSSAARGNARASERRGSAAGTHGAARELPAWAGRPARGSREPANRAAVTSRARPARRERAATPGATTRAPTEPRTRGWDALRREAASRRSDGRAERSSVPRISTPRQERSSAPPRASAPQSRERAPRSRAWGAGSRIGSSESRGRSSAMSDRGGFSSGARSGSSPRGGESHGGSHGHGGRPH